MCVSDGGDGKSASKCYYCVVFGIELVSGLVKILKWSFKGLKNGADGSLSESVEIKERNKKE